ARCCTSKARPASIRASFTSTSRYSQIDLVNSGCASSKSMIRRSGVRPAVCATNSPRGTPRRSANGHSPSRQLRKPAAAARIASACMAGCPDAPDSPLHSVADAAGSAGGSDPVIGLRENRLRMSNPWASAGPVSVRTTATEFSHCIDRDNLAIAVGPVFGTEIGLAFLWGTYMVAGQLTTPVPTGLVAAHLHQIPLNSALLTIAAMS